MVTAAALFHLACGGLWASLWAASAATYDAEWQHWALAALAAAVCYVGLCALGRLALQARQATSWLIPLVFVASPLVGAELGHLSHRLWWMPLLLAHALATLAAAKRPGVGGLMLSAVAVGLVGVGTTWCGPSFVVALALPLLWSFSLVGRARWRARGQGVLGGVVFAAWAGPFDGSGLPTVAFPLQTAVLAAQAWGPPALVAGALMVADPRPLRRFAWRRLWRDGTVMPWNAMALLGAVAATFGEADESVGMLSCAPYAAMGLSALAEPAADAAAGMLTRSPRLRRRAMVSLLLAAGAALLWVGLQR